MDDENSILEFGIKRENEERRDGGGVVIFDPETQKYVVYLEKSTKRLKELGHVNLATLNNIPN